MKKLFFLHGALLAAVVHCFAQDMHRNEKPMQYALIDGKSVGYQPLSFGNNVLRFSWGKNDYTQCIDYIVNNYLILLHLDKAQSTVLRTVLFGQCSTGAITPEDIHLVLQRKMPGILDHARYMKWITLREYPELDRSIMF